MKTIRSRNPFPSRGRSTQTKWGPPTLRCQVCRKVMTSYVNLARHMTHTAEMYPQHVDYVENLTGENFLNFVTKTGGIRRLADTLQKGKQRAGDE